MRNKMNEYILGAIISFGLIIAIYGISHPEPTPVIVETTTPTIQEESTTATVEVATVETVGETTTEEQTTEEPTTSIRLYDVPLDAELQLYIMDLCEEANISASLVMAVIKKESSFNASNVGDGGDSLGLMQIQPKWHQWRMDALGGGDWFNPYDNVTVGISILAEKIAKYDTVEKALTAYNAGDSGAYKKYFSKGIYASNYALKVLTIATELERSVK